MPEAELEKINAAVRNCLARCFSARRILPTMAEFLKELKESEGWSAAEVRHVERAALRLLQRIVDRPSKPAMRVAVRQAESAPLVRARPKRSARDQ